MSICRLHTFAICVFILCSSTAFGQSEQELKEKYGEPLKSYKLAPDIYLVPQFSSDGQLLSAVLYSSRISVESDNPPGVYASATLPSTDLQKVLDDLIPKSQRGKLKSLSDDDTSGIKSTTYFYENVDVEFISFLKEEQIESFDIDLQVRLRISGDEQNQLETKRPNTKMSSENSDNFSSGIARSAEFVRIIWLHKNSTEK